MTRELAATTFSHPTPDRALYGSIKARRKAAQPAVLTVARKIARRSYHVLHELEREAA
jgi:hypothetical protein